MMNATPGNISSNMAAGYVQLTLGKTRLLFPATEVLSLVAKPETGTTGKNGSIGKVELKGTTLPVFHLDEQLQQAGGDSKDHCACLGNGRTAFALLCDRIETVDDSSVQVVALPSCMRLPGTPVLSLAVQGARILCVSNVERMAGYIEDQVTEAATP